MYRKLLVRWLAELVCVLLPGLDELTGRRRHVRVDPELPRARDEVDPVVADEVPAGEHRHYLYQVVEEVHEHLLLRLEVLPLYGVLGAVALEARVDVLHHPRDPVGRAELLDAHQQYLALIDETDRRDPVLGDVRLRESVRDLDLDVAEEHLRLVVGEYLVPVLIREAAHELVYGVPVRVPDYLPLDGLVVPGVVRVGPRRVLVRAGLPLGRVVHWEALELNVPPLVYVGHGQFAVQVLVVDYHLYASDVLLYQCYTEKARQCFVWPSNMLVINKLSITIIYIFIFLINCHFS